MEEIKRNGRNSWIYNSELEKAREFLELSKECSGNDIMVAFLVKNKINLSPLRQLKRIERNMPEDSDLKSELEKEKVTAKADVTTGDKMPEFVIRVRKLLIEKHSKDEIIKSLVFNGVKENAIKEIMLKASEIEKPKDNLFSGL